MAIEVITMPQLGEGITEAEITMWLKEVGEEIEAYEPLLEILTDKVTTEVPVTMDGKIVELLYEVGDVVQMGAAIAKIETEGEGGGEEATEEVVEEVTPVEPQSSKEEKQEVREVVEVEAPKVKRDGSKVRYSPAVVKLSQEHGIDLSLVVGTGKDGRITRKDIFKVIENPSLLAAKEVAAPKEAAPQAAPCDDCMSTQVFAQMPETKPVVQQPVEHPKVEEINEAPAQPVVLGAKDKEIPVSGIRKAIAKNMVNSVSTIPHAWTMIEVDATNVVRVRNKFKNEFKQREGYSLSFLAFFIKAVAQALRNHPILNSSWAGDKIIQYGDINISIAIAANDLLYVPVIRNADEKSVKGIAREITELSLKARNNQLSPKDMEGGTFTVNSTGSFGSVLSMGIINAPQGGILQVESIVKRPVIHDNGFAIRDMVNLCLSIDHRLLDGKAAGDFLQEVRRNIEKLDPDNYSIY